MSPAQTIAHRAVAYLPGGRTRIMNMEGKSSDEAWGIATKWADAMRATGLSLHRTDEVE